MIGITGNYSGERVPRKFRLPWVQQRQVSNLDTCDKSV